MKYTKKLVNVLRMAIIIYNKLKLLHFSNMESLFAIVVDDVHRCAAKNDKFSIGNANVDLISTDHCKIKALVSSIFS